MEKSQALNEKQEIDLKIKLNLNKDQNHTGTKMEQIMKANSQMTQFVEKKSLNAPKDTYQFYNQFPLSRNISGL